MKQKIIQQGAEAIIFLKDNKIIKERVKKSYRIPEIDEKLRKKRTKSESKILTKLDCKVPVPKVLETDLISKKITIQFIKGKKLSEQLESLDYKKICKKIAENITKIHNLGIIHGDLTTSNMIYDTSQDQVYFIDFGLGFHSDKIEDKAVDLHLLKQALEAKHHTIQEQAFKIILNNYKAKKSELIKQRIRTIEKRGRYRH